MAFFRDTEHLYDVLDTFFTAMAGEGGFEERLSDAYAKGEVPTEAIHLSIGQEAVAVGVCFALRSDDSIATTHRGHGHMLAKGADLQGMASEMFAKNDGLCRGKGGSMHVTDARIGALGANGIVGASPLIAAGAAHAARLSGLDRVAVAFMGDGATNQGSDESVYLLGEDVTTGGYFAVTVGLVERFGTGRVVDTPISEYAIVGSAVGAAMAGRRPVAEILFSDFLTTCMDPLVNQAAKLRYMSGGQVALPMVVRTPGGAGLGMAAQHSQSLEALLMGIAGLIIMAPATPYDAKGMRKAAIRSNNPVVFFENKVLYAATGTIPDEDYVVPIGECDIKRPGKDVTIVTVGAALSKVLEAAEQLATQGIDAEVVDVRTLVPLDLETILRSVEKTGRLVTVEDGPMTHGVGAELLAQVAELAFGALAAAPRRVAGADVPIPYDNALENLALPDAKRIVEAVNATMK